MTLFGQPPYGYTSFHYCLTPFLKFGKESNRIAANGENVQLHKFNLVHSSGVYQNVKLLTYNNISIQRNGLFITTEHNCKYWQSNILAAVEDLNKSLRIYQIKYQVTDKNRNISEDRN